MNTKTFLSLLLVSSLVLASCKKELEPQESSSTPVAASPTAEIANPNGVTAVTPTQMPQNTAVTPVPTTNTAKGMNPPHGQPGHRCDIPVGAPLNSPPGKTPAPQATPQLKSDNSVKLTPAVLKSDGTLSSGSNVTTSSTPAILNAPVTTAPGMNPPHGQEGHRCDIKVGDPLPKS